MNVLFIPIKSPINLETVDILLPQFATDCSLLGLFNPPVK